MKYGMGLFRKGTLIDDDLHIEICSRLFTQMRGCSILLSHNLWFKVAVMKMEHGLLEYLMNSKNW
jgi:hypothetical protein